MNFKKIIIKIKPLWQKYQRAMWYQGHTGTEIGKPLRFFSEFGIFILLLSDSGINTSIEQKILFYFLIILVGVYAGKFLVWIGVVSYNNTLNNSQNEELMEILKIVKELNKDDN